MEAILLTPGPVTTSRATKATKFCLRFSTTEQFVEAAEELEKADFGRLLVFTRWKGGVPLHVFLKKPPAELEEVLRANPELCSFDLYAKRYGKGSPKAIGLPLRAKLVKMNLVSEDHFI